MDENLCISIRNQETGEEFRISQEEAERVADMVNHRRLILKVIDCLVEDCGVPAEHVAMIREYRPWILEDIATALMEKADLYTFKDSTLREIPLFLKVLEASESFKDYDLPATLLIAIKYESYVKGLEYDPADADFERS